MRYGTLFCLEIRRKVIVNFFDKNWVEDTHTRLSLFYDFFLGFEGSILIFEG